MKRLLKSLTLLFVETTCCFVDVSLRLWSFEVLCWYFASVNNVIAFNVPRYTTLNHSAGTKPASLETYCTTRPFGYGRCWGSYFGSSKSETVWFEKLIRVNTIFSCLDCALTCLVWHEWAISCIPFIVPRILFVHYAAVWSQIFILGWMWTLHSFWPSHVCGVAICKRSSTINTLIIL